MSKPLENYIIRIKSSIDQFDNEGVIREEDRDHIELMTRGSFTKKNGSYYSATTRRRWAPSLWASPATASTAS